MVAVSRMFLRADSQALQIAQLQQPRLGYLPESVPDSPLVYRGSWPDGDQAQASSSMPPPCTKAMRQSAFPSNRSRLHVCFIQHWHPHKLCNLSQHEKLFSHVLVSTHRQTQHHGARNSPRAQEPLFVMHVSVPQHKSLALRQHREPRLRRELQAVFVPAKTYERHVINWSWRHRWGSGEVRRLRSCRGDLLKFVWDFCL